ncbi:Type 1 glutamine amidotransferase domain-containing protein [Tenacibaculum sp. 190524A05c]|uniref:type 1 glutamine amidotransferase domain-containing protein n=1 Tax=Tenacibaculum platacis TaxID=3137852 RepID=UPI0031FA810B
MFKKYRFLKISLLSILSLVLIIFLFGYWFINLLPARDKTLMSKTVNEIPYLSENVISNRGKVLVVVTSTSMIEKNQKKTGYELTELSRAYYVFQANGFEVDIASPKGGKPPVVIDDEDMGLYDYAFLNDKEAQYKSENTIPLDQINSSDYAAVYIVGGKGAMFDFPNHKKLQSLIKSLYQSDKVVGAVCHGPAALINVKLDNGDYLLKNKNVSSFTSKEELFLIPEAKTVFPFLLQEELSSKGAKFNEGTMYLEQVSHDDNLITGQNPWSTWKVAETMIAQMGYTPKYRKITKDELAINVLSKYNSHGKNEAKKLIGKITKESNTVNRTLIAQHAVIAAMKGEISTFYDLVTLVSFLKNIDQD